MAVTLVGYLRDNLGMAGDFMKEYRGLSTEDKQDLRSSCEDQWQGWLNRFISCAIWS